MFRTLAFLSLLALATSVAHAKDSRMNHGYEAGAIQYYSMNISMDKVANGAVLRDILFYEDDTHHIMDSRAFIGRVVTPEMAKVFDGNPATALNQAAEFNINSTIDLPLGYRTTHLIIHTPTPDQLSGVKMTFYNRVRNALMSLDLAVLKGQQQKAPAWRIDLPSLKVSPVMTIPKNTHYQPLELMDYFSPTTKKFDLTDPSSLEHFSTLVRWESSDKGVQPRFTTVTSPTGVKSSKDIGYTVDGNKGSKWCVSFKRGLTWLAKLEQPAKIDSYSFLSANDCPKRDPREWKLEGSIGGEVWDTLDHRKDEPMIDGRHTKKRYSIETEKAYDHYRIVFLRFHRGSYNTLQLSEIQLGELDLKSSKEVDLTIKDDGLAPGQTVAISCEVNSLVSKLGVKLGANVFELENLEKFTLPTDEVYLVQREEGSDPFRQTLVLTRGSGERANEVTYHVLGIRHDTTGTATLTSGANEVLPIQIFFTPIGGGADQIHIGQVLLGELLKPLPGLSPATGWQDIPPVELTERYKDLAYKWRKEKVDFAEFQTIQKRYGKLTRKEFQSFKKALSVYPVPTHNAGNRLTFGGAQETMSLYFMLQTSKDPELLSLLERWCDSILEYRNGGPHYSVPFYTDYQPNPGMEVGKAYPVWNHFMNRKYIQGQIHFLDDLSAGSAGPMALLLYPKYVAAHPEIWETPCADGSITCLKKAKLFIKEAELTLNSYTIKFFADPESGWIPKPWNRYAELIEACVILEDIYDHLKDHEDVFDQTRLDTYHRVVDAYVEYIFDPEQSYTERAIEVEGKNYIVMSFGYAPKYLKWGSKVELIWYSEMDFGALIHVYESGRHSDVLTDARTMILRNTLRYLVYQGHDDEGNLLLGNDISGKHPKPRPWGLGHMLAAFVDPSFYDEFINDVGKSSADMVRFGNAIWVREEMRKRGVVEPTKRRLPKAVITVSMTDNVPCAQPVTFSAAQSRGTQLKYEWDFDRDGTPDATGLKVKHQFDTPGLHFILLKITDKSGLVAFAQETITAE